nr:hypothetical protein [Tanacetum cinerariifolium]
MWELPALTTLHLGPMVLSRDNIDNFSGLISIKLENRIVISAPYLAYLWDARKVFDEMPDKNTVSFATLIQVLKLFVNLECGELERYVHGLVVKVGHDENAFVGTALLDVYSSCRVVKAFDLLSQMRMVGFNPNNFTLSSMFKACLRLEAIEVGKEALSMFEMMCKTDVEL